MAHDQIQMDSCSLSPSWIIAAVLANNNKMMICSVETSIAADKSWSPYRTEVGFLHLIFCAMRNTA